MEGVLQGSDVDWISVRPPRLVSRAATGAYRHRSTAWRERARRQWSMLNAASSRRGSA